VNRDLSSGNFSGRKDACEIGLDRQTVVGRSRLRVTRDRHPAVSRGARSAVSRSRNRGRKATGFYEESLSMEGIPGVTSHRLSRVDGDELLGGSRGRHRKVRTEGEATGVSEAKSFIPPEAQKTPASKMMRSAEAVLQAS